MSLAKPTNSSTTQAPAPAQVTTETGGYRLPDSSTLQYASKLSIVEDKPILFDYWTSSIDQTSLIGVKGGSGEGAGEKLLVKSEEEYTSPIAKIYKVNTEYIVVTENSIYIVDGGIPTKRIAT